MTYGLIFSAGKETRFDDDKPKALSIIGDVCLLDHNVSCLSKYCDIVYIVCNHDNKCWFDGYNTITIDSGYGCGDAVLQALANIHFNYSDNVYIAWGDCVLSNEVILRTQSTIGNGNKDCVVIPCTFEHNPYVRLIPCEHQHAKVEFAKYGEVNGSGFHDFGIFHGRANYILQYLSQFHAKIYDKNANKYVHKHNNEMQFLDVLNETDIEVLLLPFDDAIVKSFNTKEELKKIRL